MKKFISTERKGFKMTFENGITVSVQWGPENYCDNKWSLSHNMTEPVNFDYSMDRESDTAEVAIMVDDVFMDPALFLSEDLLDRLCSTSNVIGYVKSDDVVEILMQVKNFDTSKILMNKKKIIWRIKNGKTKIF